MHLRGLPYRATEREIADWLTEAADPVEVSDYGLLGPVDGLVLDLRALSRLLRVSIQVIINMGRDGRPDGSANAVFETARDAKRVVRRLFN